jgi:hypothetical protein
MRRGLLILEHGILMEYETRAFFFGKISIP